MHSSTIRIGALNIEKGGHSAYQPDLPEIPERAGQIRQVITGMNLDVFVGSDVQGWENPATRSACLPPHLQQCSDFVPLNDQWLKAYEAPKCMDHLGVAIASDVPGETETLDLCGRQALSRTMSIGKEGLRIVGAYLNHEFEDKRAREVAALMNHVRREAMPTVIIGDLNAQEAERVTFGERVRSGIVRAAALGFRILGHPAGHRLADLERGVALSQLTEAGAINVASHLGVPKPTALQPAWLFRVDHAYTLGIDPRNIKHFETHPTHGASDHRAIAIEIGV